MEITSQLVKELRERTGAGMMDCKRALEATNGDLEKAVEHLRKASLTIVEKKKSRTTNEGIISSYVHLGSKIGVLVEVNCETDFVARNEEFVTFAKEIAMQVAAANPRYLRREDVPEDVIQKEKEIYKSQIESSGKPPHVIEKIINGKLEKFFGEICLMEQAYIRNPDINIQTLLNEKIAKLGENISIRRFVRYQLGE